MKRRGLVGAGLGLTGLAALALVSMPVQSQGDVASRLSEFGVPDGAEVIGAQAKANGEFVTVIYLDANGQTHTLGGIQRLATPSPQ